MDYNEFYILSCLKLLLSRINRFSLRPPLRTFYNTKILAKDANHLAFGEHNTVSECVNFTTIIDRAQKLDWLLRT